ncbi:MAG TPA: hypothetical protein PK825_03985 [Bacteroidales bacterium]|nr:hypothetical protein [Bacteroidales bacterium]
MSPLYLASRCLVIEPAEQEKFGIRDVVNTMVTEDELPDFSTGQKEKQVLAMYYSKKGELCIGEMMEIKSRPGLFSLTIIVFRDEMSCRLFILKKIPGWLPLVRYMIN